jgi:hypothetical protein
MLPPPLADRAALPTIEIKAPGTVGCSERIQIPAALFCSANAASIPFCKELRGGKVFH